MPPLSYDDILAQLRPEWWADTFPTDAGTPWPVANLYWQDTAGNTDYVVSTGPVTGDRSSTVERLRSETARYLVVSQCVGSITNTRPSSYQPQPIYFR